jgi:hypothetical protein
MNNSKTDFIFDIFVIKPLEAIIARVEAGDYRDCDIPGLNTKLQDFMQLAADSLYLNGLNPRLTESDKIPHVTGAYSKEYYLKHFGVLLSYFQSI